MFQRIQAEKEESEGGELAKDEEEKAEDGEVEKEMGGKHQCEHCGKNYVYKHKLAHHKTWLCKEVAPTLVQVEPRRKLSSNVFHLPTIPEREDGGEVWRMEPNERGDQGEGGLVVGEEEVEEDKILREGEESGGAEVSGQAEPEVSSDK